MNKEEIRFGKDKSVYLRVNYGKWIVLDGELIAFCSRE